MIVIAFLGGILAAAVTVVFSAVVKGTVDFLVKNIALIPSVVTFLGLLWAIGYPLLKEARARKKNAALIRRSIKLYLNVLKSKIDKVLHSRLPLASTGAFETENKINHEAIERLFLEAEALTFQERNSLEEFIEFFKESPLMQFPPDYRKYQDALLKCLESLKL